MIAIPFLASVPAYALARRRRRWGYALTIAVGLAEVALCVMLYLNRTTLSIGDPYGLGLGLHLKVDGFRALYAAVASFMWLMTSLMLPQYLAHGHARPRYLLFTLLTMGATVGVFLSDDLVTAFLFFEIMSLTSYCWVAHEQTPQAMRAAQTYLAIAVLGGMAMLMGLMLLAGRLGTLTFEGIGEMARGVDRSELYLPGALILAGFGAKAGMFPLHVWLPKAHPVAPAPASALLSGVLTKVGIFGILVISSRLFFGDALWGNLLLGIGLVNMFLGALLALLSVDLKRTLACSSMSQIGFILVGIGMQNLLGEHNALAAMGTVMHMLNHSLIKLVLFLCAGAVYMNLHHLNLNDIRGYGRGRWGLMACFLVGAASIAGLPFFSGYASKTLLHESIVEYIVHLEHLHLPAGWYAAAEWVFIISGGMTLCYMIKLFVALFIEKHPKRQQEFDRMGPSMGPMAALAVGGAALLLFLLGLRPEGWLDRLATAALPFLMAHPPEHAVHYLAEINLIGGAKSWAIGVPLYFLVVRTLLRRKDQAGVYKYVNLWPDWLDLENAMYRPLVTGLTKLGYALCIPLDLQLDWLLPHLQRAGEGVAGLFSLNLDERILPALRKAGEAVAGFFDLQLDRLLLPVLDKIGTSAARALDGIIDAPAELITQRAYREAPVDRRSLAARAAIGLGRNLGQIGAAWRARLTSAWISVRRGFLSARLLPRRAARWLVQHTFLATMLFFALILALSLLYTRP